MKTCSKCSVAKPFEDFYKRSRSADGYNGYCKSCDREIAASLYLRNAEIYKAKVLNRYKCSDIVKSRHRVSNKKYKKANRGRMNEDTARYRARKIRATPRWLTAIQIEEMKAIYTKGVTTGLTVDHIIPLRGKTVCGLHVPWNLQLLTRSENSKKNNQY